MRWNYIHIDDNPTMMLSGWKLYITGYTIEEARAVSKAIKSIVVAYNLTTKIATPAIIKRNTGTRIPWGVAVIYLRPQMFSRELLGPLLNQLITVTVGLTTPQYSEYAMKSLSSLIRYRYDLKKPVDPRIGVDYDSYLSLYRGEKGRYNIRGNKDLTNSMWNPIRKPII